MDQDQQRDYEEEAYWRAFCPACGSSPCDSDDGHAAELIEALHDVCSWIERADQPGGIWCTRPARRVYSDGHGRRPICATHDTAARRVWGEPEAEGVL